MQMISLRFCHIGTKRSVLWTSKYAKVRFGPGFCHGPRWGSSRRSPRPSSRLRRGHTSPYPTPLGTDPPSALVMRPPEFQPDLRLPTRSHRLTMNSNMSAARIADVDTNEVQRIDSSAES